MKISKWCIIFLGLRSFMNVRMGKLDNYQVYTQVPLENKGLCAYVPKN